MVEKPVFHVGVTFHSFAREYLSFAYSFEDMMEKASLLGGGVEIVGPSHHRGFPYVSDEFERSFKSALERYELTPTCYDSFADPFMLPDRALTADELYEYTVPQLKGAAKLGFPVVRLQHDASGIAERLVPWAEKLNLKLAYELHTPLMIETPQTQELLKQIRTISSDRLGVMPDCGIFGRSIPQHYLKMGREGLGIPEEQVQRALELWAAKTPIEAVVADLRSMGAAEETIAWVGTVWDMSGFSEPSAMAEIMPYIFHVHGKFFNIVDGDEPDLRYEEVVKVLIESGFTGWMSSEFEGGETDSFVIVQAHQKMVKGYIEKYSKQLA